MMGVSQISKLSIHIGLYISIHESMFDPLVDDECGHFYSAVNKKSKASKEYPTDQQVVAVYDVASAIEP